MINLLNKMTLEAVKTAYTNQDEMTLNCLGLKLIDAESLSKLSPNEIDYIFANRINCVQITVDSEALQKSIESYHRKKNYDELITTAVKYGATRDIMYHYAKLSHNKFTEIRKQLAVQPSKATNLSEVQMEHLEKVISVKSFKEKQLISLPYLIDISKQTNLTIGAIYAYLLDHWGDKYDFK